ncbi:iron ABC transporter permease [Bacillus carboniphilus]|uniref:Iron ABC transporter permease n=1 Tax=Bacillus carboniphilus TaxID=86663 RepID=A0ABY9K0F0_9BACI|nr:iron ABC transporter permease [Bacillus carboniphilus]WLR44312.1 iron ABC transporter permease [Bacillus carboniphilus]
MSMLASLVYGYTDIGWGEVYRSFTSFDGENNHLIVQTVRLPRSIIAAVVGSGLAIAGVLMQAITRNPLASPTILGINSGAGFFIVFAFSFLGINDVTSFMFISFLGAAIASIVVFVFSSIGREGVTPMKLTLAGAAIAALFSSLTQGLLVINEAALDQVLFWLAGSVQGRDLEQLYPVLPFMFLAIILSFHIANQLNLLSMGDEVAEGLGVKTIYTRLIAAIAVVLLAGGAVSVAGPIGFIGIIIPHVSRFIIGTDHRWLIPLSGLLGGILLVIADISARYVVSPEEAPVGVMTSLIGIPLFVYIARKGVGK